MCSDKSSPCCTITVRGLSPSHAPPSRLFFLLYHSSFKMEDYSAPPPYRQHPSASGVCSADAGQAPQARLRPTLDPPTGSPAALPRRYLVNGQQVRFLETEELSEHLALLHAFRALRKRVETSNEVDHISLGSRSWGELLQEERWRVYVSMAVKAFEKYVDGMKEQPSAENFLCCYAHLLHPE